MSSDLKARLIERAAALGFDACRVTTASPPDHASAFVEWIADGRQGEMQWIARNAHKRVDPQQVLPGARSIICLAASYSGDRGGIESPPGAGVIARYARGADYHDVVGERLKELSQFLDALEPGSRSLWYVDTGPLLERDLAQRAGVGFVGKHTNLIVSSVTQLVLQVAIFPDPFRMLCHSLHWHHHSSPNDPGCCRHH